MKSKLVSVLVVLLCIVLLGGAAFVLIRVIPQKKPDSVISLETNGVFDHDNTTVEPDREQAYEGDVPDTLTPEEPQTPPSDQPETPESEPDDGSLAKAQTVLAAMTQEEKLWQLFFVTPEALTGVNTATRAGETTKDALEKMPVGGIIYFAKNLEDTDQTSEMLKNTQSYVKIPLFLGVDEEGGRVARVSSNEDMGVDPIDAMGTFGESGDIASLYNAVSGLAAGIHALGFNFDFAPVADVSSGKNSVIGDRSFGTDASLCASMVSVAASALTDSGVVPCLKHFPGYGSASADDHNGPAEVTKTLEELEQCDLVPFVSGIEKGAPFIMVSHLSVPALTGGDMPCDLSYEAVTETLRNKMGFTGVIITDAQNMASITSRYDAGEAAVQALKAGVDMILMPDDLQAAYDAVSSAVGSGSLSAQRIDESVLRILQVKAKYGLLS